MWRPRRGRLWLLLAAALLLLAGVLVYRFIPRTPDAVDLIAHLPSTDAVVLYVDAAVLRAGGVLDAIAGPAAAEEAEYKEFVRDTGFEYRRDLDIVVASVQGDHTYVLAKGRFDLAKLEAYARKRGGKCADGICSLTGSRPERKISFARIGGGALALAVGSDPGAVRQLLSRRSHPQRVLPQHAVWAWIPPAILKTKSLLPPGTRAFASALANAESITMALGQASPNFEALLDVVCATPGDAAFLQLQLEEATELLKSLISREKKEANPSDLSGVLTAGAFRRDDRRVLGRWPIDRRFIQSLTGGAI